MSFICLIHSKCAIYYTIICICSFFSIEHKVIKFSTKHFDLSNVCSDKMAEILINLMCISQMPIRFTKRQTYSTVDTRKLYYNRSIFLANSRELLISEWAQKYYNSMFVVNIKGDQHYIFPFVKNLNLWKVQSKNCIRTFF